MTGCFSKCLKAVMAGCVLLFAFTNKAIAQPLHHHHRNTDGTMNWGSYNTAKQYYDMQQKQNATSSSNYSSNSYSGAYAEEAKKQAREWEIKSRTISIRSADKSWRREDMVLDQKPTQIQKYPRLQYVRQKGLWGVYNPATSDLILRPAYSNIIPFAHNRLMVVKGKQVGVVSTDGKQIIPVGSYATIEEAGKLFLVKTQEGKFGVLNETGGVAVAPKYKDGYVDHQYAILVNDWGNKELINEKGQQTLFGSEVVVVRPDVAIAKFAFDQHFAFYNPRTGAQQGQDKYDLLTYFWKNDFILAKKDNRHFILDATGRRKSKYSYDQVLLAKDSTIYFTKQGSKTGILDILIENHVVEMLPPIFDEIYSFDRQKGVAEVKLDGAKKQVSLNLYAGAKSISPFKGGVARVFNGEKYYYINEKGLRYSQLFDEASDVLSTEGMGLYAVVGLNGKKGHWFFSSHNNKVDQIAYEDVGVIQSKKNWSTYSSSVDQSPLAKAKVNGKWGVVRYSKNINYSNGTFEHSRSEALPFEYDGISLDRGELVFVKQNDKWGALSWPLFSGVKKTETIIPIKYNYIERSTLARSSILDVYFLAYKGKKPDIYTTTYRKKKSRVSSSDLSGKWETITAD